MWQVGAATLVQFVRFGESPANLTRQDYSPSHIVSRLAYNLGERGHHQRKC
jgi:hypothetical protein